MITEQWPRYREILREMTPEQMAHKLTVLETICDDAWHKLMRFDDEESAAELATRIDTTLEKPISEWTPGAEA